jgi:hypothetical protein
VTGLAVKSLKKVSVLKQQLSIETQGGPFTGQAGVFGKSQEAQKQKKLISRELEMS